MEIFDKIYLMFYLGLKRGFGHAERASHLLSISIFVYIVSLSFMMIKIFNIKNFILNINPFVFIVPILIIGIVIMYSISHYFVGTGRYRQIINKYGGQSKYSKGRKALYLIISLSIFFGAFVAFAISIRIVGGYLHP